jgi:hypothetical protein
MSSVKCHVLLGHWQVPRVPLWRTSEQQCPDIAIGVQAACPEAKHDLEVPELAHGMLFVHSASHAGHKVHVIPCSKSRQSMFNRSTEQQSVGLCIAVLMHFSDEYAHRSLDLH